MKLIMWVIVACIFAIAIVNATGASAEFMVPGKVYNDTTGKEPDIFEMVNEDRSIYGIGNIGWNWNLSNNALRLAHTYAENNNDYSSEERYFTDYYNVHVAIVKKQYMDEHMYHSIRNVVSNWKNSDRSFAFDELNRDNKYIGVGITECNGYYYMVMLFGKGGKNDI